MTPAQVPPTSSIELSRLRQSQEIQLRALPTTAYPAVALWVYFYFVTGSTTCLYWAVVMHTWQAYRIVINRQHEWRSADLSTLVTAERRAVVQVIGFAAWWGAAPWIMVPRDDPLHLSVMVLMLVGVMAGSTASLALTRVAGTCFIGTLGLSLSAWLAQHSTVTHTVLAISAIVLSTTLWMLQRNLHRRWVALIEAQTSQEQLTQTLSTQKNELEHLHLERSRLFAATSHDLRQPLYALRMQVQALEGVMHSNSQSKALQRMSAMLQSLSSTLDSVLNLYQIEQPDSSLPVRLNAQDVLFECGVMWHDLAVGRGLDLRMSGRNLELVVPPVALRRVLNNLIDNALKYTRHGGVLVAVRLRTRRDAVVVRFEVWDTGDGIAQVDQHRVFQPLFRGQRGEVGIAQPGIGMGLASVQHLCTQQGWHVFFRTVQGRGSVFFVEIPAENDK
jgi:signal transduction histidine kinase